MLHFNQITDRTLVCISTLKCCRLLVWAVWDYLAGGLAMEVGSRQKQRLLEAPDPVPSWMIEGVLATGFHNHLNEKAAKKP